MDYVKSSRLVVRRLVIMAAAVAMVVANSPAAYAEPESATAIVEKMLNAYRTATSYEDEGITLTHDPQKPEPDEIVFATAFRRSGSFRFEWTSHHPYPPLRHLKTYAVTWSDATGVHTFRQPPARPPGSVGPALPSTLRDDENMRSAIAGATGVSRGSAHHVLRLLRTELGGFAISDLQSLALAGTDVIEGTTCHHLTGSHPRGDLYHFWVGKTDYLIRRITSPNRASGEQVETRRNIRINHPIPDDVFNPPRAKITTQGSERSR